MSLPVHQDKRMCLVIELNRMNSERNPRACVMDDRAFVVQGGDRAKKSRTIQTTPGRQAGSIVFPNTYVRRENESQIRINSNHRKKTQSLSRFQPRRASAVSESGEKETGRDQVGRTGGRR